MKIDKKDCITIKQFKAMLSLFDENLPVIVSKFVDRHPFDGEGTDMSGNEPIPFVRDMLTARKIDHGMDNRVDFEHLNIDTGSGYF